MTPVQNRPERASHRNSSRRQVDIDGSWFPWIEQKCKLWNARMYYSGLEINETRLKLYIGISLDVATRCFFFLFTVFVVLYDIAALDCILECN